MPRKTPAGSPKPAKKTAKAAAKGAKPKAPGQPTAATHTETESHPWTIRIPDHPRRTDSVEYIASRKTTHEKARAEADWFYGHEPYEDHHGGGLWVKDDGGWFVVRNLAGIEWSAQFCADPAKVDALRVNAKRLYDRFPEAVDELGIRELLDTPIVDADGVAQWTDSLCNASLALPKALHTGVLPAAGGIHHYPAPIAEITLFKYDDFQLWQTDGLGKAVAVVPTAARRSGVGATAVAYAEPGSSVDHELKAATGENKALFLPEADQLSVTAFKDQYTKLARGQVAEDDPLSRMAGSVS